MRTLFFLFALCCWKTGNAQKIFGEDELVAAVKRYHPVVKQASVAVRIAAAELRASRGGFDPRLQAGNNQKEFDGLTYYQQQTVELKVPTWYGVDVYAGAESLNGARLNPEETKGRINYIGVSVPLAQNLLMDKRRAALQQAKIFLAASAVEQRSIVNNLMQEALTAYWMWWQEHRLLAVVRSGLRNAQQRLAFVRTAYNLGDRPAIDTIEALTQVQVFEQREAEVSNELLKARLQLSLALWTAEGEAYELPADVQPQDRGLAEPATLDSLLAAATVHPDLALYDFKLQNLQLEKRLKFQELLPEVTLKYNQTDREVSKLVSGPLFENSYRFGLAFALPLRLSEGRGAYAAAKLKLEQTRLAQAAKQLEQQVKVKQYYTEWTQTVAQGKIQEGLLKNYAALQRGEELRFANGEGSLFLINSREQKTIEAQQKLIELQAKQNKAAVGLRWAAGLYGAL